MIRYPLSDYTFKSLVETQDFLQFVEDHLDDAEATFNLIDKLFPSYNEQHPERPHVINLQNFLQGFAELVELGNLVGNSD